MKFVFITGTDTDCGKTFIASSIIKALSRKGVLTIGFKPVASGAIAASSHPDVAQLDIAGHHLVNEDALSLYQAGLLKPPYQVVNPYCFAPAIAPHVAAEEAGQKVTGQQLTERLRPLGHAYPCARPPYQEKAQLAVVEGAGGWAVPLNDAETLGQWALGHDMGIILVVGLKLGCINHAMLTAMAITASGGRLVGWVANQVSPQPMQRQQETIDYLARHINAPLLKEVGYTAQGLPQWQPQELSTLTTAIGCNLGSQPV